MAFRPRSIFLTALFLVTLVGCLGSPKTPTSCNTPAGNGSSTPTPTPVLTSPSTISSIAPANAAAGGAAFTLSVTGLGFVAGSTVNWNGASRTTTDTSATELTASITAADVAAAGAAQITVVNPAPNAGTSNPVAFVITGTAAAGVPGYVYVANAIGTSVTMGNISVFSVDPSTGSLAAVPGSPFQGGAEPSAITVDPSGKFLYETSNTSNLASTGDLLEFTIDSTSGALTPIPGSPFNTGALTGPFSLSVDATGKFLYVANFSGDPSDSTDVNSISEYSIDATTGALTSISQASCVVPPNTVGLIEAVVADPVAGFLFAANPSPTSVVCAFSINAQGMLQTITGSPYSLGGTGSSIDPRGVAVDPTGRFVYTANYDTTEVSAFSITPATGALVPVAGSPFSNGGGASNASSVVVDPMGRFVYTCDSSNTISGFSINSSTGALSTLLGFPLFVQVAGPTSLAVDPSGQFLYLTNSTGQTPNGTLATSISAYAINGTTGALTPVTGSPYLADGIPAALTVIRKAP